MNSHLFSEKESISKADKDIVVYVIIVTFNGEKWVEKCVKSLNASTYSSIRTIVIDNKSTDNTLKILENNFNNIKVFKLEENYGFGYANNIGIDFALKNDANFVFLLNQDCIVFPDTIKKLIDVAQLNQSYGVISPIHLNGSGDKLDELFSRYVSYQNNNFFYSDFVLGKQKVVYEVPFVNGAAWLIPSRILKNIGGFDPYFFHYGEDEDYCNRLIYHKYKIVISSEAFIMHDRENRTKNIIPRFSKLYFQKKKRSLKLEFGNLNQQFLKRAIARRVTKYILKGFFNLFIFRLTYFYGYLKEALMILCNIKKIKIDRETAKKTGPTFL